MAFFFILLFELLLVTAIIYMFIYEDELIRFEDKILKKIIGGYYHDRKIHD